VPNIPNFGKIIISDTDKFTQVMTAECANTVIKRTAVDTASLVGSEHITTGSIPKAFEKLREHGQDPGGARARQMSVIDSEIESIGGHKFYLQTNAPYAMKVHHAPYLRTGTLRFMKLFSTDIMEAEDAAGRATR